MGLLQQVVSVSETEVELVGNRASKTETTS